MLLSANFLSLLCFVDRRQKVKWKTGKNEERETEKPLAKTVKRKLLPFGRRV